MSGRQTIRKCRSNPTWMRRQGHLVVFTNVELKLSKLLRNAPITSAYAARSLSLLPPSAASGLTRMPTWTLRRLQQYCVLNQILEFHGIVQAQVGRLAALKDYMQLQRPDLMNDRPGNDDVDVYVGIVQRTFQVREDASASLGHVGERRG